MKNARADTSKKILYESLCTTEVENLSEACMSAIEGRRRDTSFKTKILKFFKDICFCGDTFKMDLSINESVFSTMFYLEKNAWNINKIFIDPGSEKDARDCVKLLELSENINYKEVDPNSIAAGFRMYIEENLRSVIPLEARRRLIKAYEDNNEEAKGVIVPRIPFVLNDSHRLFLKSLRNMFMAIEANSQKNEVDINEIHDMFAPIIIRRPNDMLGVDGKVLRAAFVDLMKADFDEFPMSFYSP